MIISVPHSGTRSLRTYLREVLNDPALNYWHFGQNDPDIAIWQGPVYIPLRDPMAVANSWKARYPGEPHKGPDELVRRLDMLLAYDNAHADIAYYTVESLPVHEGRGPEHKHSIEPMVLDWYNRIGKDFYEPHYPEGFWWNQ